MEITLQTTLKICRAGQGDLEASYYISYLLHAPFYVQTPVHTTRGEVVKYWENKQASVLQSSELEYGAVW